MTGAGLLIIFGCGLIIGAVVGSAYERSKCEDDYERWIWDEDKLHEAIKKYDERQHYYNQESGC